MRRARISVVSNKKIEEESRSSEKLVGGARSFTVVSWSREKSSILFWRSRILRKKSLDSSETGFTEDGGDSAGPSAEYESVGALVGGGGCRVMNAGTIMKISTRAGGMAASRYGSKHINV